MSTYFIGCLHLDHPNMAKHRGFDSSEQHDNLIIENWNKTIGKRDKVFILGDITMEKSRGYYMLDKLPGYKHVIMGNHDRPQNLKELMKHVDKVQGFISGYKGIFQISHAPVHPYELVKYNEYNIHAHTHEADLHNELGLGLEQFSGRYFNTDAKKLGYTPISYNEILERLNIII